ncbi:cullin 3 [Rhodotorula toruloides]|uniref:Cullin 3 n=1 Tax=Rhodotorula toruloides TaxID=5286 RepID=A0A511K8E8_RHOTO|nr:cullin 3 [Rhodotorula toruloides]
MVHTETTIEYEGDVSTARGPVLPLDTADNVASAPPDPSSLMRTYDWPRVAQNRQSVDRPAKQNGPAQHESPAPSVKEWERADVPERRRYSAAPFGQWEDDCRLKVLVVGSGYAGLAAAIACARQGYSVTVLERGSGKSPHGDLLTLGSNCVRLLARWGLFTDLWQKSARGGWWLLKDYKGNDLEGKDLRDFPAIYGAPLMQGHRAQYLGVLGIEARMLGVEFETGTEVVEFNDSAKSPSVVTARGETLFADCIVVADGVSSYARAYLAPELGESSTKLRSNESNTDTTDEGKMYSVHRGAMTSDKLRTNPLTSYFFDGCIRTFLGPDSHLKIAPLDNNQQVSFTYVSRSRYKASLNWRDRRPVAEVTERLKEEGWDPSVMEAVSAFRTCLNWAVEEDPPAERWCTDGGKIVLLGDAVHALSPMSFQGASQAIADGASLAVCLALAGGTIEGVPRALQTLEALRRPRVLEAQQRGTLQRKLWHGWFDNPSPAKYDLLIAETYDYDVEMHTLASFERVCQKVAGDKAFVVDPAHRKTCMAKLEINGPAEAASKAFMEDWHLAWDRGGERPQTEPADSTLDRLKEAIQQIQQHNVSQLSFEEHYRYAYNLVLYKKGHLLYNAVAELISAHLEKETRDKIVPSFPHSTIAISSTSGTQAGTGGAASENVAAAAAGQLFLDRLRDVWDDHIACMSKLRDVLKYLDKVWTNPSSGVPAVYDLGLSLFFHHVVLFSTNPKPAPPANSRASTSAPAPRPTTDQSTVAHHLLNTLLNVIRIEREGEVVSRSAIRSAVGILSRLTDEGPVPLPVQASQGTGSGSPVINSGAAAARQRTVMGEGPPGAKESPYKTTFEQAFLKQTEEFYARESARLLIECDCPSFLQRINRRLEEESTRAQSYLNASTEPLLMSLLDNVLIEQHLSSVLEHPASGLSTLIQDSRTDDLKLLYTLFGRVGKGHPALQAGVSAWIVAIGKQINEGVSLAPEPETRADDAKGTGKAAEEGEGAKKKPEAGGAINAKTKAALAWVQNVLDLKDKFDTLLAKAFASDKAFEKSINDAFSVFVNENRKSPEYISLFIDENLRKGLKGKTEAEVDEVLNKSVALFRFLTEKDAFEKYYNQHLSKRLINQRSVSDDAERSMLAKFRVEAGHQFTKSAEGMMKDVKVSEDTLEEYKRFQDRAVVKAPFDIEPIICGSNVWPFSAKDKTCTLPKVLQDGIKSFETFYNQKHSGRKLTFMPDQGSVEVRTRFKARTHELNVSTYAMVVLALFEGLGDDEKLSYVDIANSTNMLAPELKRTLQTLACAKYKVLTKHPKGRDVNETDSFSFNSSFTAPLAKIRIQTVAAKVETDAERKETESKVDEARNTQCDACIVRVMKDRKQLQHMDLVNEVIRQLSHRFQPTPQMIKKSIERLIEKEYLERDDEDRKKLKYMA